MKSKISLFHGNVTISGDKMKGLFLARYVDNPYALYAIISLDTQERL